MRVDGVKQPVAFYSLDVILGVGYTNTKSVKEGIFLLKKNNELRKGGYLKSFHKDIMKVVFFVCILFLLFFIIHTKLQKSIELQVLEVHDTYLILQDLQYSNDYMVNLVGKESTDFNVGDLVIVTYNGDVTDTAPASLGGVTEIKPLKK